MSVDGTKLLDEGKEIYRGKVAEGPKLFKRNGYYYISLPEGGVETGWQTVLRSRNIYGPYERKEVFPPRSPHQGGLVELKNGDTWFISFKSTGYLGRICYLNPVRWTDDDWPVFGDNGQPVDGVEEAGCRQNISDRASANQRRIQERGSSRPSGNGTTIPCREHGLYGAARMAPSDGSACGRTEPGAQHADAKALG